MQHHLSAETVAALIAAYLASGGAITQCAATHAGLRPLAISPTTHALCAAFDTLRGTRHAHNASAAIALAKRNGKRRYIKRA